MSRRRVTAVTLTVAVTAVGLGAHAFGGSPDAAAGDEVRVDAIFDAARGIGPRQVVKVAGAPVGTVTAVHLTRDFKARVEMRIDARFAGFREDASCAIKPEGIITENFIGCSPGDPRRPPLARADGVATVPVGQTAAPVALQDLFDVFQVPTAQRLRVLLNELGLSTAGRGDDLNAILYRAAPTLGAARRAIRAINEQSDELGRLIDDAEPVLGRLARSDGEVKRFLAETARLTHATGSRQRALDAAIARMPALLSSARPALQELRRTAIDATPTLRRLRVAAPDLTRLTRRVAPFARAAGTGLHALDPVLRQTATTLRRAAPTTRLLARFARDADPAGRDVMRLLTSMRDAGAVEGLLRAYYLAAGSTNRFDRESHVLPVNAFFSACYVYARKPTRGCNGKLDGTGRFGHDAEAATRHRAPHPAPRPLAPRPPTRPSDRPEPDPQRLLPHLPAAPDVPVVPAVDRAVDHLLDFLLK